MIAYYIQGQTLTAETFLVALPFAFLMMTMVLSNNIRDIKKDKGYRMTVPMILGKKKSANLLLFLTFCIYSSTFFLVFLNIVPIEILITFLALPVAIKLQKLFRSNN